jgi:hypothetical protein
MTISSRFFLAATAAFLASWAFANLAAGQGFVSLWYGTSSVFTLIIAMACAGLGVGFYLNDRTEA